MADNGHNATRTRTRFELGCKRNKRRSGLVTQVLWVLAVPLRYVQPRWQVMTALGTPPPVVEGKQLSFEGRERVNSWTEQRVLKQLASVAPNVARA